MTTKIDLPPLENRGRPPSEDIVTGPKLTVGSTPFHNADRMKKRPGSSFSVSIPESRPVPIDHAAALRISTIKFK